MKIAYFDCISGISGDMVLGSLLDAGLDIKALERELGKLGLKGYSISGKRVRRLTVAGTKFDVKVTRRSAGRRTLKEIFGIINMSRLDKKVKETASAIFENIGKAEAKVHGCAYGASIHFHELGDIDSIVDIVGAAIALKELGIDEVHSSAISMGRTMIDSRHGRLPVPAPAAMELLKGIPTRISDDIREELVTPTGAAILKTLSKGFGEMPEMTPADIGYGAGTRELKNSPNMLRVVIGERKESFASDKIFVIEANIDDMSPQGFEYISERLFTEGALDVYTTVIQMKKSRPAFKLTVLAEPHILKKLADVIFSETTTIGVRFYEVSRLKLRRETVRVGTKYGDVTVKISKGPGGIMTVSPEYEECVKVARTKHIPFKNIYDEAKRAVKAAAFAILLSICGLWTVDCGLSAADTIQTRDGKELKGIVVEDYRDRITFSTIDGEISVMKTDIEELYYDSEEDNLIKLAEQAVEKGDNIRAFAYYDRAFKVNPDSKRAKDGIVFLQGYLFRKEQAQKEEAVKRQEDFERGMVTAEETPAKEKDLGDAADRLRKNIGFTLELKKDMPRIIDVSAGSPAHEAGMKRGDFLVAVWGRLTGYMTMDDIVTNLLEKASLEVKCTIERTYNIALKRKWLVPASLDYMTGLSLKMEFDGLTVSGIKDGSPAFDAGIQNGDLIMAIDGKSTRYMPLKKASDLIRGARGPSVKLTIRREMIFWRRGIL